MIIKYPIQFAWLLYVMFLISIAEPTNEYTSKFFNVLFYDNTFLGLANWNKSIVLYAFIFVVSLCFPSTESIKLFGNKINKNNRKEVFNTLCGIYKKFSFAGLLAFIIIAFFKIGNCWDVLFATASLWMFITFAIPVLFLLGISLMTWIPRHTYMNVFMCFISELVVFSLLIASLIFGSLYALNHFVQILLLICGIIGMSTLRYVLSFVSEEIAQSFVVYNKFK